ncbi:MAG: hypothetical protein LBD20_05975 [Spirochaetaceae bacterium]|jgi:hypothetical protein|nr:hypothetical protein [Spirochaetaceae bacterium]
MNKCLLFVCIAGFLSCSLDTQGTNNSSSDGFVYFLKVESAVVFYNLGDQFDKQSDFKAYKYRQDGHIRKVPNNLTTVYIDGDKVEDNVRFNFYGSAIIRVEYEGLSDEYRAVVNNGNGLGGGGSGGSSGHGGSIGWDWGS